MKVRELRSSEILVGSEDLPFGGNGRIHSRPENGSDVFLTVHVQCNGCYPGLRIPQNFVRGAQKLPKPILQQKYDKKGMLKRRSQRNNKDGTKKFEEHNSDGS